MHHFVLGKYNKTHNWKSDLATIQSGLQHSLQPDTVACDNWEKTYNCQQDVQKDIAHTLHNNAADLPQWWVSKLAASPWNALMTEWKADARGWNLITPLNW